MWISRLTVDNFCALQKAEIRPNKKCVLLGENNAGKSSILRALELVLSPNISPADLTLEDDQYYDGIPKEKRADTTVSVEIECDLEDGDDELIGLLTSLIEVAPKGGRKYFRVRYEYGSSDKFGESKDPSARVFFPYKPDDRYSQRHRGWMPMYLLEALRDVRQEIRVNQRTFWGRLVKAVKLEEKRAASIKEKVGQIDNLLLEEPLLKEIKDALTKTLSKTMGIATKDGVDLTFTSPSLVELLQTLTVSVKHKNTISYSLQQHGLGLQNVVFFGVVRAFLEHHRKNVGVRNIILGIEEPEAHLHPHLQRTVYEDIGGIPNQVFVTTHSPHVANKTDPRDIVLVRRGKDGSTAKQIEKGFLDDLEAIELQYSLDASRSEALFSRAVILVEGDTEMVTLPLMAAAMDVDLDSAGISLLNVRGVGFQPFLKLFNPKGLSIPHVVLTDVGSDKPLLNSLVAAGEIDEKQKLVFLADPASFRPYLKQRKYHMLELDFERTMLAAGHIKAYRDELKNITGDKYWEKIERETPDWGKMKEEDRVIRAVGKKYKVDVARQVAMKMRRKVDVPAPFAAVITDAVELAQA